MIKRIKYPSANKIEYCENIEEEILNVECLIEEDLSIRIAKYFREHYDEIPFITLPDFNEIKIDGIRKLVKHLSNNGEASPKYYREI